MGVQLSIDSTIIDSTIIPLTAVLVPNKLGALWGAIARTRLTATLLLLHYSHEVKKA
jgi:hypothetical protein